MREAESRHSMRQEMDEIWATLQKIQQRLGTLEKAAGIAVPEKTISQAKRSETTALEGISPIPPPELESPTEERRPAPEPIKPAAALPPPLPIQPVETSPKPPQEKIVPVSTPAALPPAPPRIPPAPPGPDYVKMLQEQALAVYKWLGPKEKMSWEMALGTFWLPRIGMLVLSVGVVFLLTLAIHRWGQAWLPYIRLAAGYGICAVLLYLAHRLESRSRSYARVLLSGGIAMSYLATYATYYAGFTRIFSSPAPTLTLLAAVVVGWAAFAQKRRSNLLACAVTGLGHLTIAISTITLETTSPLSVAGLLALSAGSAFFLVVNKWYYVAALGMAGSYANHVLFLAHSPRNDTVAAFVLAMTVLVLYWLIFAGAEFFSPESLRRRSVPIWMRTLYTGANSGAFLFLSLITINNFEFARPKLYVFFFVFSTVLALTAWGYRLRRAGDPLSNAYLVKGISLVTIGLAAYFQGYSLMLSFAVEAVVLLYAARRGGFLVTRLFATGAAALALGYGFHVFVNAHALAYSDPEYKGMAASVAITLAALYFFAWRHATTPWMERVAPYPAFLNEFHDIAWELRLVSNPPGNYALDRPLLWNGWIVPYVLVAATSLFTLCWCAYLATPRDASLLLILAAFGFTALAAGLRFKPFTLPLTLLAAGAVGYAHFDLLRHASIPAAAWLARLDVRAFLLAALLGALAEACRVVRAGDARVWPPFEIKVDAQRRIGALPLLFSLAAAEIFSLTLMRYFPGTTQVYCFAAALAFMAVYAYLTGAFAFHVNALIFSVLFAVTVMLYLPGTTQVNYFIAAIAAVALFALATKEVTLEIVSLGYCALYTICVLKYLPYESQPAYLGFAALAAAGYAHLLGVKWFGFAAQAFIAVLIPAGFVALQDGISWGAAALGLVPMLATALLGEKTYTGERPGSMALRLPFAPYLLYGAAAFLLGVQIVFASGESSSPRQLVVLLLLAAGVATLSAPVLHRGALSACGAALYAAAIFFWFIVAPHTEQPFTWHLLAWAVVASGLFFDRFHAALKAFPINAPGGITNVGAGLALAGYADLAAGPQWYIAALVAVSAFLLAYGLFFRAWPAAVLALAIFVPDLVLLLVNTYPTLQMEAVPMTAAYAAFIAYALVAEKRCLHLTDNWSRRLPPEIVQPLFAALSCTLLVLGVGRIPVIHDFYLTIAWAIAALAMFGYAWAMQIHYYRYAGLATLGLALLRVIFRDTRDLDGMARIAAYIGLGAVLLFVAYGYILVRNRMRTPVTDNKVEE